MTDEARIAELEERVDALTEMVADLAEPVEGQQANIDKLVERQGTLAEALQDAALDTGEVEEAVEAAVKSGATEALGTSEDGDDVDEPDDLPGFQ